MQGTNIAGKFDSGIGNDGGQLLIVNLFCFQAARN